MKEVEPRLKASRITGFLIRLRKAAPTADHSLAYDQKHFIDLVETMLEYEPEKRPTALQTNHELVELGGENQIFHEGCCRKTPTQLASMRGSIVKILKEDRAAQTCEAHELRTRLSQLQKERDTKDAKVQELEIVRNLFESSIEKARMDTARSWARQLDAGKKRSIILNAPMLNHDSKPLRFC